MGIRMLPLELLAILLPWCWQQDQGAESAEQATRFMVHCTVSSPTGSSSSCARLSP